MQLGTRLSGGPVRGRFAHVDWSDSKGLNEWERKALELSEERSKISALR